MNLTGFYLLMGLLLVLMLAGCSSVPKERIEYQRVEVPITQPCRPELSAKPVYPTLTLPVATDIHDQMKTLLSERDLRQAWELELEAAVSACAGR